MTYAHRANHLWPMLTGQIICGLCSQGNAFVAYAHRAMHLWPMLTGQCICGLCSQGNAFVAYSSFFRFLAWNLHGRLQGRLRGRLHGRLHDFHYGPGPAHWGTLRKNCPEVRFMYFVEV